ncbi:MAG: hypothetical protein ACYC5Y_08245 [Symbiobacteriia bacterium]
MENRGLSRRVLRWVVMLVIGAMVLGMLFWPLATAFGAETAPAAPATTPATGSTAPATSTAPANPHAGVPGAPGGTPATAAAPASPLLAGKLGVEVTHLVLTSKEKAVSVFQMVQFFNDTDKDTGPVTAPLPAGASNLEVIGLAPDQYSQTAVGLIDRLGLKASESKQLTYRFDLPADGQALTLRETFAYPVGQVFILTDPATMTMPAAINTAFEDAGGLEIKGRVYRQLARGEVEPGEVVQVSLQLTPDTEALAQAEAQTATQAEAAPAAAAPAKTGNVGLFVVAAALVLAVGLVALTRFSHLRRQQGLVGTAILEHGAAMPGTEALVGLTRRKADLIDQIAGLDAQKAQGDLDEVSHAARRDTLKQELIAVMRELRSREG